VVEKMAMTTGLQIDVGELLPGSSERRGIAVSPANCRTVTGLSPCLTTDDGRSGASSVVCDNMATIQCSFTWKSRCCGRHASAQKKNQKKVFSI
jgi:hypothetical protein